MTPQQALTFVKTNGVVLESGRGPVQSMAEAIAGEPIRGSWWAHPKANDIFQCSRAVRKSTDVLVCRLVGGKVTYVHRLLWPALVRLAGQFDADRLAAVQEVHTPSGRHAVSTIAFPDWVQEEVARAAEALTDEEAIALLPAVSTATFSRQKSKGRRSRICPPLPRGVEIAKTARTRSKD